MGAPVLDPAKIPFKAGAFPVPIKGYPLRTQQGVLPVTVTSMGNPHCSVFVRSFDPPVPCAAGVGPNGPSPACGPKPFGGRRPEGGFGPQGGVWPGASAAGPYDLGWEGLGREIETNPLFPNRTNVEFVKVISRKEIAVQFWERGVGHTMSSGTGACAATVASILNGLTERQVRVQTQAGSLLVAWPENGEVILTGLVERIAQGTYNYEF
jgi:diaminopimelate epimerase